MPPRTPKQWSPVARLTLVSLAGQTIIVSTNGTIPGKVGQGRNRTDSMLASWSLFWGDGQQQSGSGAPPLTLTHIYANTTTTVTVRLAVVDVNTLTAQATLTITLTGAVLAAPTAVTAVAQLANQTLLTWDYPVGAATQFQIYRATGTNPLSALTVVDGSLRQYTDTGLTAATTYIYAVAALTQTQSSALSATASITTAAAPTAPTTLAAVAVSSSQIDLTWTDNSSDEAGFQIERGGGGSFALIATVSAGVTSFSDTGLTPLSSYSYQVRAYNINGSSAPSNTASATTLGTVPAAPSDLNANAISATAINLQWTNNGPATTIRIERRIGVGAFSTLTSVSSSQSTFSDTGLTASTTYGYRVFAVNGIGDSAASNIAEATTLAAVTIPTAPSGLNGVAASPSQINLTWTDNSSNESGFIIERGLGAGGAFAQVATVAAGTVAYSDSALAQSQLYRYQVRAYNAAGSSAASNQVSVTTLLAVPAASTNLSAVATSPTAVHLAWTAPVVDTTHGTPSTLLVQRRISPAAFATIDTISASLTVYDDPTAAPSTTYQYRLIAQNASGNSSASATASVTTPAALPTPPAAPSLLSAVAVSATRVNLAWTDNSAVESGMVIERAIGAGAFSALATVSANVVSYIDNSVVASTTYNYRVYAYNGGGNSANSNTANVTTPALAPPAAPSNLTAVTQSTTTVQLGWQDNSANESGFSLERKLTNGVYTVIQTLVAGVTVFLDSGLLPATTYTYRVRAFNANGNSGYSNEATTTTLTTPPSPPTCTIGVDAASVVGIPVGTPTTISMTATPGSAAIVSWLVTLGDGTTQGGSGLPPSTLVHVYPSGTFDPILVVTDSNGLTGQDVGGPVNVTAVTVPGPDLGGYRPQMPREFGMDSVGGRGDGSQTPIIIRLDSLNWNAGLTSVGDGTLHGGLKAALLYAGPAYIVGEQSGTINAGVNQSAFMTSPFKTVALQTAPALGINLSGSTDGLIEVNTHDVVFQHFRVRVGNGGAVCAGGVGTWIESIGTEPDRVIFDHISCNWGQDENLYAKGRRVTFWRCLTAEALYQTPGSSACSGGGTSQGHGILFGDDTIDCAVIGCLIHSCGRGPEIHDNNVIFIADTLNSNGCGPVSTNNPAASLWYQPGGALSRASYINYRAQQGPSTPNGYAAIQIYYGIVGNAIYRQDCTVTGTYVPFVFAGNDPTVPAPTVLPPIGWASVGSPSLRTWLAANVGARPNNRDAADTRYITEVLAGTGQWVQTAAQAGGYYDIPQQYQKFPVPQNPFGNVDQYGRNNLDRVLEAAALAFEPAS